MRPNGSAFVWRATLMRGDGQNEPQGTCAEMRDMMGVTGRIESITQPETVLYEDQANG